MFAGLRRLLLTSGLVLLASCAAWAQTTTLEGDVLDENGQPMKGAVIVLNRTDIKGHYQVKSDKKGHWLYTGLPYGKYDIECQVDGKTVDKVARGSILLQRRRQARINFDLRQVKSRQGRDAAMPLIATGRAKSEQQSHAMTKEQKEAVRSAVEEELRGHEEKQGPE